MKTAPDPLAAWRLTCMAEPDHPCLGLRPGAYHSIRRLSARHPPPEA